MPPSRPPGRVKVPVLVVLALLLAPAVGPVAAHALWKEDPALPHPWYMGTSVWTGSAGYLFGNAEIYGRDRILRFDPDTFEVTFMEERLPVFGRANQAAAWNGTHAFVFGGTGGGDAEDRAYRYDPAADDLVFLPTLIPGGRDHAPAVFDPRVVAGCPQGCIYLFGGQRHDDDTGWDIRDDILRYDPSTDVYTTLPVTLPSPRFSMSAAFDGDTVWLFGGQDLQFRPLDEVLAFDPVAGTVRTLEAALPEPRYSGAAVWNGSAVLLAGGRSVAYYKDILAFDPVAETFTDLGVVFPTGRWGGAAFAKGDGLLLLGGLQKDGPGQNVAVRDILHYDPHLAPAPTLTATPGPGRGEVTLRVEAPAHADGITGYELRLPDGTHLSIAPGSPVVDLGPEGTPRTYRARSLNDAGAGAYTPVLSVMPPGLPGVPTALATKSGPQPGDIRLTWKAPLADGGSPILSYRVHGGDAPGATTLLAETSQLSFTDHDIAPGATRWYRVSAVNSPGEGPLGLEVAGTPPTVPSAPGPLDARQGLQKIDLVWTPPASDGGTAIQGYVVYRGRTAGSETPYAEIGNVLAWSDTGRAGFMSYSYRVAAVNGVGEGPLGAADQASALGPATFKVMLDATVVVYDDADDDNVVDEGEALLVVPLLA